MIRLSTTKATHRGITAAVMADRTELGTVYSCTNCRRKPKANVTLFPTQREVTVNERQEIDAVLHR